MWAPKAEQGFPPGKGGGEDTEGVRRAPSPAPRPAPPHPPRPQVNSGIYQFCTEIAAYILHLLFGLTPGDDGLRLHSAGPGGNCGRGGGGGSWGGEAPLGSGPGGPVAQSPARTSPGGPSRGPGLWGMGKAQPTGQPQAGLPPPQRPPPRDTSPFQPGATGTPTGSIRLQQKCQVLGRGGGGGEPRTFQNPEPPPPNELTKAASS